MSKKTHVSDVDFVVACRDCPTAKEVAEKLNMTLTNVYVRAKKMRNNNPPINIPEFNATRSGRKRDVEALNTLLAEKSEENTDADEQAEKLLEEVTA